MKALLAFGAILITCTAGLTITTTKPKPAQISVTYLTCPMEKSVGEGEALQTCFWATFSQKPKQTFRFEIKPIIEVSLVKSDRIMVWGVDNCKQFQPDATYTCRFSSSNSFRYHGKTVKELVWKIKTPDKETLADNFSGPSTKILHPIDMFIPITKDEFHIDNVDKDGVYKVTLKAPFNAGVNGPPISTQCRQYYAAIAIAKKKVISWIEAKGQNPTEMRINWVYTKY